MALYPIKVLLDKDGTPFIPFLPADAIPINGSEETIASALADRYTKEEVDEIIEDLGTLQRLCGRVATVADLANIQDPQPGDTYLVGTPGTNNAEYMWIGNAWEELGPMIDLSAYYTKTEVDNTLSSYETIAAATASLAGKLDTAKVKSGQSTTVGDVYDVTYINSALANISTAVVIKESDSTAVKVEKLDTIYQAIRANNPVPAFYEVNSGNYTYELQGFYKEGGQPRLAFIHTESTATVTTIGMQVFECYVNIIDGVDRITSAILRSRYMRPLGDYQDSGGFSKTALSTVNTASYTPTADYHPATKKYVDDIVGDIETLLGGI